LLSAECWPDCLEACILQLRLKIEGDGDFVFGDEYATGSLLQSA
jgi:hypothetical protein